MIRARFLAAAALVASACASAPPTASNKATAPPPPSAEQKLAWILRLEDQRVLRDPAPAVDPTPLSAPGQKAAVIVPPPPPPDLLRLLRDEEARIRRRAALAVGHVGLADGVDPLIERLSDEEAEVREMAAFALGLLGDARARAPLVAALADPSPLAQSSAAEALGLIGDPASADAIGKMIAAVFASGSLAQPPGEADDARRDTPTAAARLGIFALVRLKAYPQLAAAVLDDRGEPRLAWWPVAYALGRLEDKRALPALLTLARDSHPYTRAFAVKGLGALKDSSATSLLLQYVSNADRPVRIEAIRAVGRIGDQAAAAPLLQIIRDGKADAQLRLEAVTAIGGIRQGAADRGAGAPGLVNDLVDTLLDVVADPSPPIRAAALRSTAALDAETFVTVLSGLDADTNWSVRSALASTLGTLRPESVLARLRTMLKDTDQRVMPSVLGALAKLNAPDAVPILLEKLKADDPIVRAAAAEGLGTLKPDNAAAIIAALSDAYQAAQRDGIFSARAAALAALAKYGAAAAPVLRSALADKDWAIRVRAAQLLKEIDPASADSLAAQMRPAPTTLPMDAYQAQRLIAPSVSTQVYLDTDRGTIQIELAVVDAPLTVENFVSLARKGYFNGLSIHRVVPDFVIQDGDPRGDGEGGPGYTIRDELNERPYLRGVVGMALDPWRDTGGSQWFITHSPQPHLDAKYTVFGRVVAGMDVVDRIQQWDVIRSVRVWDGQTMSSR